MTTRHINVYCRLAGAIGMYEWKSFEVAVDENATRDEIVDAWQKKYGHGTACNYELHHMAESAFKL